MPVLRNKVTLRTSKFVLLRLLSLLKCDYPFNGTETVHTLLKIFVCHLYFKYGRTTIFPSYDFSKRDIYKRSLISPEEEKRIEYPVPHAALEFQGPQELIFTGMRTSGELVVVQYSRTSEKRAQIHIVVRDSKGQTFSSPDNLTGTHLLDISHGNKFHAGGLRIHCMEPMRKWRVAFNGLLLNSETGQTVYARLVFLWFAMTHVVDWSSDIPSKRLMKFCLDTKQKKGLSEAMGNIDLCRENLKGYEQTGYCVGEVQLSYRDKLGEEQTWGNELHLRGNFMRIKHPQISNPTAPRLTDFTHDISLSKKGHCLQLSTLKFSNNKSISFGSFVSTPGFKDPVETILNSQGLEANEESILYDPLLKFRTFELSHELMRSEGNLLSSTTSSIGTEKTIRISSFDALIDEVKAIGISIQGNIISTDVSIKSPLNILDFEPVQHDTAYVLSLAQPQCKNSDLTGGKGSSLAVLTELSKLGSNFAVPSGFVVTSEAFRRFMQSPKMYAVAEELQKVLEHSSVEEVKVITDSCIKQIVEEQMPTSIARDISEKLREMFPDGDEKRFAIRSSCVGEDSEDMSAAGQMETFLGIKGEQEIITSVLKCWASQFSHVAVEYKRRYGQELVSDMAVVIMEMVPADSAGVMFTCDPLTGDPSVIYITSNFGLGESVVSAMADPDTYRVKRDIDDTLKISEVIVGKKDVKIVMDEKNGTRTESIGAGTTTSITKVQAELLAKVGCDIQKCYGDWRDVEWAYSGDVLFMLQARPVTFMDKPSDDEIITDFESCSRAENACFSKANVGEVLNGAISPLGINVMSKTCGLAFANMRLSSARERRCALTPYCFSLLRLARYHYFFDLTEAFRSFIPDPTDTRQVESMMLNLCGRIIDDDELYEDMNDKTDKPAEVPFLERTRETFEMKYLAKAIHRYYEYKARKDSSNPAPEMSVHELFNGLMHAASVTVESGGFPHMNASNGSSLWTSRIVEYLQDVTDESIETIYGDMSKLLASAEDVVSCNVPKAFNNLAAIIASEIGREKFLECSAEQAEKLLMNSTEYPQSAAAFSEFLRDHKHRGYNEFDIYRKPWGFDSAPVMTTLQSMLQNETSGSAKAHESIWKSISGITCKLTLWQKMRLASIVYFARSAVGRRENTKSLWIWTMNMSREWSWALARKMKSEGRIPDEDLLFFCTLEELLDLIKTRNPAVIARAYHRKRLFPMLVDQQFPEYFRGIPKPGAEELPTFEDGVVQMKGFPISKGRIQAKARVISKLEEANQIQRGEILITYATDIGWSPYFPLLGGIVTELGGLMSHGAVVAREYGLPCVVGLNGARKVFQTGDTVLLDGSSGILVRIDQP